MSDSPYLRDLQAQGQALRDTLDSLRKGPNCAALASGLASGRHRAIILSGMGSSLTALMPLQLALVQAGHLACCVETSELMGPQRALLRPDVLLVLASQSGESAEIVHLLSDLPPSVCVLGITNTANSTLARTATHCLLMQAGLEATVACKTYVATLAVSLWSARALCGLDPTPTLDTLESLASTIDTYWSSFDERLASITAELSPTRQLFYVGRGPSLPSALTAGLVTKESTGCAAEGLASPAFRHGPFELCGPNLQLLVFAGDAEALPLNKRLADDARRLGAHVSVIGRSGNSSAPHWSLPVCPDPFLPFVEILPVQLCTLALASLNGREAGVFRHASKVTTTA
jgi:glutamine---fructose-6-phosphate transaminase (isomerizing)